MWEGRRACVVGVVRECGVVDANRLTGGAVAVPVGDRDGQAASSTTVDRATRA